MEQMINSLGFPVACVVGLAYYFVQKDKSSREDINKIIDNLREDNKLDRELYRDTIDKFDSKLDKFAIITAQVYIVLLKPSMSSFFWIHGLTNFSSK